MNAKPAVFLVLMAVSVAGCRTTAPVMSAETVTTLYFGLGLHSGGEVSETEFQDFIDREITPRSPDGFTIQRADGAWRQDGRTRREPSRVLTILHHDGLAGVAVESIRDAYCRRFSQDAVLRIDGPAPASFRTIRGVSAN